MKRNLLIVFVLIHATGCSSMSHTETGAIGGGLLGGVGGAIIGSCVGAPKTGALVGAGLGALAGGAAGHREDRAEAREAAAIQAATARQLSLTDIATMARSGNSDVVIINQIRTTGSVFNLTPDQITWLHTNGVSDPVITEMQARQGVPVIYRQPYRRVYVVEPPPPPPGVSVGVIYSR